MAKPKIRFKGYQDDWEQRKSGDMAPLRGGFAFKSNEYCSEGVPIVRISNILSDGSVGSDFAYYNEQNYDEVYTLYDGAAVLAMSGATTGKVSVLYAEKGQKYYQNQRVGYFVPTDTCEYSFIRTIMRSQLFADQLSAVLVAGAQPNVSSKEIDGFEFMIPKSIDEQRWIGEYFQSLDRLITLHQRKRLGWLKVGKNDWEQRKLSELTTMHARIGWQNLRTSEFLDNGEYMLITGTDFNDGAIDYSTCHYVEKERYDQDKNIQIHNGNILITKDGTLGKVAYVQGLTMPATLNAGVFNVEIKDENLADEKYLFQYLKAPFLMDYVSKKATGGTIKHLNQSILVDFPVAMPKKEEQAMIGDYFESLDHLITLHQQK